MFDLHLHSTASDGKADFATVVRRVAEQSELRLVSLTDHDAIIDSVRLAGIEPRAWVGTELTTKHGTRTVDMLALNVRPDYSPLNDYLAARKIDRVNRFNRFGEILRSQGWIFDPPAEVYDLPQIAKPHVVEELRRHPQNVSRLVALGAPEVVTHRRDNDVIYDVVLDPIKVDGDIVISTVDAIGLTHAAGGIAVVAHPWIAPYDKGDATKTKARRIIAEWASAGLDGLEVFHESAVDTAIRDEIAAQAAEHGLLITAGCDDHSANLDYLGTAMAADHPQAAEWLDRICEVAAHYR